MNTIKTVVIEDQKQAKDYLLKLLMQNFNEVDVVAVADSVEESIELIDRTKPELVLLDIQLKDGLSFEILDRVNFKSFEVVFTTGFDDYYQKAFEYCAFNYLLKPIDVVQLEKVLNKYKRKHSSSNFTQKTLKLSQFLNPENPKIMINIGDSHLYVAIKDIITCKADGSYTKIMIKGKSYLTSRPLKYYEDLLSHKYFFKAHRSVLVNISRIVSIYKKETLILDNGEKIQVSARNKYQLIDLIKNLS